MWYPSTNCLALIPCPVSAISSKPSEERPDSSRASSWKHFSWVVISITRVIDTNLCACGASHRPERKLQRRSPGGRDTAGLLPGLKPGGTRARPTPAKAALFPSTGLVGPSDGIRYDRRHVSGNCFLWPDNVGFLPARHWMCW